MKGYRRLTERDIIRRGDIYCNALGQIRAVGRCGDVMGRHWSTTFRPHYRLIRKPNDQVERTQKHTEVLKFSPASSPDARAGTIVRFVKQSGEADAEANAGSTGGT